MPYVLVSDFRLGVDRSRPIHAGGPGTLWSGINGHLTRGGDFETSKGFVATYALPAGLTFGMQQAGGVLHAFGSGAEPPDMPAGVTYQRLQHPDGATSMSALLWSELFNGKIYAIARFSDGETFQYYDGSRITDWDDGYVLASFINNDGIATHLAAVINANSDGAFTAAVAGSVITITKVAGNFSAADKVGATTLNKSGGTDDQTATVAYTHPSNTATVTIGGTFEAGDRFSIDLEDDEYGYVGNPTTRGLVAKTLQRKVYVAGGSQLGFSGVDTAIGFTDTVDTGAGQINMSNHLAGAEDITALAVYQKKLAVFSRLVTQIWLMFADPADNDQDQVLEGTGTRAPGSVRGFGDLDVFYLSDSGVRSLRARDITNTAGVNDVGTPIDTLIREWIGTLSDATVAAAASIVEPIDGRYWLAVGGRIFVFTYFPSKKISAWSWYEPGFTVSKFDVINDRVYARSGDTIYLYGGASNDTYTTEDVTLQLPFLTGGKPGHFKAFQGFDLASEGEWTVTALVDPNDLDVEENIGDMEGVTFASEKTAHLGMHTHVAPKLVHSGGGYASLSNVALYFQGADSQGGTE